MVGKVDTGLGDTGTWVTMTLETGIGGESDFLVSSGNRAKASISSFLVLKTMALDLISYLLTMSKALTIN